MASRPPIVSLTNSSVDVLNAIRNSASTDYRNYVPIATEGSEVLRKIGAVIMDYPAIQNEFLNALINRIGKVYITSKMYENPWSRFKKGYLEFGESIEEVFVELAKPFEFDPGYAETNFMKREKPDVRSAFHIMNFQKFYKQTVSRQQLQQAFLSINGVTELITKIIEAMYTAMNYDEFQTMKYMMARAILDGRLNPVEVPSGTTGADLQALISEVKGVSNNMEFLSTDYNLAGVHTKADKGQQNIIINAKYDALIDVNVLASAFNMSKAEFMGKRVLVDSFGKLDDERLDELFGGDTTYVAITEAEKEALDAIPCLIVDDDWFMIYDILLEMRDVENGEGLYWQYWYHTWKTFSISPFANNAVFVPTTPSVTSVTISPSEATVEAGTFINLSATVETEGFAPQTVVWTSSDTDVAVVDQNGKVTVLVDAESASTATITATSTFDGSVSGTATITVG